MEALPSTTNPPFNRDLAAEIARKSIDSIGRDSHIFIEKSIEISERIKEVLKDKNISQSQLAIGIGKSKSEISRMLSGNQNLTIRTLAKVEAFLSCEIILVSKSHRETQTNYKKTTLSIDLIAAPSQKVQLSFEKHKDSGIKYANNTQKITRTILLNR